MVRKIIPFIVLLFAFSFCHFSTNEDADYVLYLVNPKEENIQLYWKNYNQVLYGSIQNLKKDLEKNGHEVLFITNAGMYKKDQSPQGLFIQNKIKKASIDSANASGNFYLKPNGIFYITSNKQALVVKTEDFKDDKSIELATQSGPMLVIDGHIHSAFQPKSSNLNIRSGVGILPNNQVLFAMSKKEVNFYEFAQFFKNKGCKNALYLDGFVSRTYCPKKQSFQLDGNFGVLIGITKKN